MKQEGLLLSESARRVIGAGGHLLLVVLIAALAGLLGAEIARDDKIEQRTEIVD